jgi:hypothetical protein
LVAKPSKSFLSFARLVDSAQYIGDVGAQAGLAIPGTK